MTAAKFPHITERPITWQVKEELAAGRPFPATGDIFHVALNAVLAFSFGFKFSHNATEPQIRRLKDLPRTGTLWNGRGADEDRPMNFPHAEINQAIEAMLELGDSMEQVKSAPSPRMKWCDNRVWVRSAVDRIVDGEDSHAQKEGRRPAFFSKAVMDEVFGFIVAGHDTMSTTMCRGVKLLADHPDWQSQLWQSQLWQSQLQQALLAALGSAAAEKRAPTVEEIMQTSVSLVDATMEEILRCGGTVPIMDREATRETTLLGHRIPKGTLIFFLQNSHSMLSPGLNVDKSHCSPHSRPAMELGQAPQAPRSWNDLDIDQFKPGRWLVSENTDQGGQFGI
ncbi:cytochrome P450 [Penicillium chermesinum]|uniref:Cytochrome P450 n=1 Tax=Penicillium chermesinum TaxID=63820 RepID=A0A9W9PLK7_9EURO|nr:cytochrome P450 [Penicillium chermesinum]KAJ5248575.1 cytochrome P450 [Penicillium chermesinum]